MKESTEPENDTVDFSKQINKNISQVVTLHKNMHHITSQTHRHLGKEISF